MAVTSVVTGSLDTGDATDRGLRSLAYGGGINEDVMQQIWDISGIPLPFTDMIASASAKQEHSEWMEDALQDPDLTNAQIDGADITSDDSHLGNRVGNHCQISTKRVKVSTRAQESDVIGQANALSYQVIHRQKELRRDVEAICMHNQASVADTGAVAGKTGGLPSWIATGFVAGGTASAAGGFSTSTGLTVAATNGVRAALTEKKVRDAFELSYNEGGNPTKMMSVPAVIRKFSEYLFTSSARIATLTSDIGAKQEKATAVGAVNVFVTDFGTLTMVPNRLQQLYNDTGDDPAADLFILDPEYLRVAYLHGYRVDPLAKVGLADVRLMCVDWMIKVLNEKAHAMCHCVDPTAPVTAS